MVTEIKLTKGYVAIVDDEDADLARYTWGAMVCKDGRVYARRGGGRTAVLMHREILSRILGKELKRTEWVDHFDNVGLHNWRSNLRLATPAQNLQNSKLRTHNKSGYKGVSPTDSSKNPWMANIMVDGKKHYIGSFPTPEAAHEAYCQAALRLHGEFANFGDGFPSEPIQLSLPIPAGTRGKKAMRPPKGKEDTLLDWKKQVSRKEKKALVIEMHKFYLDGHTLRETGEQFGLSRQRIQQLFRAYCLPALKGKTSRIDLHKAYEEYLAGRSFKELGERYGVKGDAIYMAMWRAGFKMKPQGTHGKRRQVTKAA